MVGEVFDLSVGRDELDHRPQIVRVTCLEVFEAPDHVRRVRFRVTGGGPTNVPRWETWPTLVYDVARVASMLRSGVLVPVVTVRGVDVGEGEAVTVVFERRI